MEQVNRVAEELAKWNKIEDRLRKSYKDDLSLNRAFLVEKLSAMDRINVRVRKGASPEERMELRILREQRRAIERKLFPNRLVRLFRRLFVPILVARSERIRAKRVDDGIGAISEQLQKAGLGELKNAVELKIRKGAQNFSVPTSRNINEREQIHVDLRVHGNADKGYRLEGYKATLFVDGKDSGRQHHFQMDNGDLANIHRSGNLLAGRAVKSEADGRWQKFDLNDKDANGNYPVRNIADGTAFELKAALKSLGITEKFSAQKLEEMQSQINAGNIVALTLRSNPDAPEILLSADGQKRSINAHDRSGKAIPSRIGKAEAVGTIIRGIGLSEGKNGKTIGR